MPLLGSRGAASVTGFGGLANLGYFLRNSLRFRASNDAYLSRTPASAGNQRTWTWSGWVKRGVLGSASTLISGGGTTGRIALFFNTSDQLEIDVGGTGSFQNSTAVFRDPAAWYHVVWAFDTTQGTGANRSRIYVNGTELSLTQTRTFTQNTDYAINGTGIQTHGTLSNSIGGYDFDGYLTEINFVNAQQLTPSSFAKTDPATGQWVPKKFGGAYGTNGFYLKFDDSSAVGKDSSGNGNNWSTSGHSVTPGVTYDLMTDVPTLGPTASNYATWNPLSGVGGTWSNGNLQFVGATDWRSTNGTIAFPTSGQWYFEATLLNAPFSPRGSTSSYNWIGVGLATNFNVRTSPNSGNVNGWLFGDNGYLNNFASTSTDSTVSLSSGDVIRIGVDTTNNTYTLYKNAGLVASSTFNVTAGTQLVPYNISYSDEYGRMAVNFGQRPFAYPTTSGAFSGYKALNTFNLP